MDDKQNFLVDECWENRGKLKWNLRPLHVHFKNEGWCRDKLRLFMQDFRRTVGTYDLAVPPDDMPPYTSTTEELLVFYFHEAELSRSLEKSENALRSSPP